MLAKKTKASTCLFVKCNPGNNRIAGLSSGRLLETSLRIRVCVDTHMYSRRGSTGRESYGVCANTHARLKNFAVVSPRWPVCFILIGNFSNNGVSAGNMKFHCCACLRFHSRVVSMHRSVELYSLKSLYAYTSGSNCSSIRHAVAGAMRSIISFLPTTSLLDFPSVAPLHLPQRGPVRVSGVTSIGTGCVPMLASVLRGHFECAVCSGKGETDVAGRARGIEKWRKTIYSFLVSYSLLL